MYKSFRVPVERSFTRFSYHLVPGRIAGSLRQCRTAVVLVLLLATPGCSVLFKSMIGPENWRAMQLAGDCRHEEALTVVRLEKYSVKAGHALWAATMESALLLEMGREDEAVALYDDILAMPQARKKNLTRAELDQLVREMAGQSSCQFG